MQLLQIIYEHTSPKKKIDNVRALELDCLLQTAGQYSFVKSVSDDAAQVVSAIKESKKWLITTKMVSIVLVNFGTLTFS